MDIREITSKSILSKSAVFDYVINPYVGCQYNCTYCYARFMKRFTGHKEPWGEFVDVKTNAPELLAKETIRKQQGRVWVSGVCDPYQPVEAKYELTRKCLEILVNHNWPFTIQTKSNLILRDIELLTARKNIEAGLTITTSDERIRRIFEPNAPPVKGRLKTLEQLHGKGIRTYAMIAPMLPGAEGLAALLEGKVDYILIDRMNYHHADRLYKLYNLQHTLTYDYIYTQSRKLAEAFTRQGVECQVVF
jgi:DNA repair photolyase